MSYEYDLPDFKRYLNDSNSSYRVDGLIFWQNRIPLPMDLFNRMFEDGGHFFSLYTNHLMAALIACECPTEVCDQFGVPFEDLPSKGMEGAGWALESALQTILDREQRFHATAAAVSDLFQLEDYQLRAASLASALCHQGKKYVRLHCPVAIHNIISARFPQAAGIIGSSNTDMFGNVIADHYNIYRSGFSDALAIIFNKHLDFRLMCHGHTSGLQRVSLTVEGEGLNFSVVEERTRDGSLWEPDYQDDHVLRINPEHPFYKKMAAEGVDTTAVAELLYEMSVFENSQFSDSQKKLLENMRQEISRELWINFD